MRQLFLFSAFISMVIGCVDSSASLCVAASEHISECTGEPLPPVSTCESDAQAQAELIIEASCQELAEVRPDSKADGVICDWFGIDCKEDELLFEGPICQSSSECVSGQCVENHCFAGVASDEFARTMDRLTNSTETAGNLVTELVGNSQAWQARVDLMNSAEHSIHIAAFYMYDDAIGQETLALCKDAVERGVEVRVFLDEAYMRTSGYVGLMRDFKEAGVEVMLFNPLLGWGAAQEGITLNRRLHQKVLIVDGKSAIQGGRNWAEHYLVDDQWRDSDVLVIGPAVHDIQRLFLSGWDEANTLEVRAFCFQNFHCDDEPLENVEAYYPPAEMVGTSQARVLFSRPWRQRTTVGFLTYLSAIRGATKEILITNAYFIPSRRIRRHLKNAVRRGVRVRVITNSLDSSDPKAAWWGGANYYKDLVEAGIEINEWQGSETMHAKSMVVDGELNIVGSWNVDPRSARSNSESLVITRLDGAAAKAQVQFETDMARTLPAPTSFNSDELIQLQLHRIIEPFL